MTDVNLGLTGIMGSKAVVFCLLVGTLASPAENAVPVYGVKGHSITLEPEVPNVDVMSVEWIFDSTLIALWEEGESDAHRNLLLDSETFSLTIFNLQKSDSGLYTCAVNQIETRVSYLLTVRDAKPVYGMKGHNITLEPEVPHVHVESVEWALNNTVIARWEEGESDSFPNLLLDSETFSLTILNLQKSDSGLYTIEVNHIETGISYLLTVRDTLLELRITKQCNSTTCTLHCTGADNVQVSWTANRRGKEPGPVLVVKRSENLDVIYTCTTVSQSWNTKSISEKELFSDYSVSGKAKFNLGTILGLVAVVLLAAVGAAVYWRREVAVKLARCLHQQDQKPQQNKIQTQNKGQTQQSLAEEECQMKDWT